MRDSYIAVSPDGAAHWPQLFARVRRMWLEWKGWDRAALGKIRAPTLVIVGDDDAIRTEHALDMRRAIPRARLFVVPGTGHSTFNQRPEWMNSLILAFLDEPMPAAAK